MCVDEIDRKENKTKKDKNKQSCSIENKAWATDPAAFGPGDVRVRELLEIVERTGHADGAVGR